MEVFREVWRETSRFFYYSFVLVTFAFVRRGEGLFLSFIRSRD